MRLLLAVRILICDFFSRSPADLPATGGPFRRIAVAGFVAHPIRTLKILYLALAARRDFSLRLLYFLNRFPDGFDVIHCHYGHNGLLAVKLRRLGIKGFIGTVFHGYDMSQFIVANGPHVYDELFASGDLFLPVTSRWRERLIELGCPADRTLVHRMGVDPARFGFRPRSLVPGEQVRLLTVARLVPSKGHEYLLKATRCLCNAGRDVSVTIAGDGPLGGHLRTLAEQLGVSACVRFLGRVSQNEVLKLMQECHILAQPSITAPDGDQEGLPVVLMEAMAAGLPVISTRHSGIPELVEDGVTGLLVPERDADALAKALLRLIDSPELWSQMTEAGRQRVESAHDIHKLNKQLESIYYQYTLLSGRK